MTHLHAWAGRRPDKLAVQMSDPGASLTFRELDERADRVARWLVSLGLPEGATIVLLLENHLSSFELWWGARRAGLYYVPISILLTPKEVAYIVRDCAARMLISSTALHELAFATAGILRPDEAPLRFLVDGATEGFGSLEEALARVKSDSGLPERMLGRDFLYSSGTTGFPKGIRRPLLPYARRGELAEIEERLRDMFQLDENTIYLSPAPLYHATGRWNIRALERGASCVIMPRFDPQDALAAIERHRITHGHWVPTMFSRMLALPDDIRTGFDLSSQRRALHAAAPCPVHVKEAMVDWWGPIIHEYYAGSESVGVTYISNEQWLTHKGSVGRPILGEVHIVSEEDNRSELACGQIGLVYFSGGPSFEYHNDAKKTRAAFNERGWGTYGDLGYLDESGFLYISDRRTDLIISGGVNIYPQEAENVLLTHPEVEEVAVIGVPNEDFGQEVKAIVKLKPGVEPAPGLAERLIDHCRESLSRFKCPRTVDFVGGLPRNENGKLLKRVLRDQYADRAKPPKAH